MEIPKFFKRPSITKVNAEMDAADAVLNPLLAQAGVQSIKVDGKDVPASDAPLADRISALDSLAKAAVGASDASQLIVSNDQISRQLESTQSELAVAKSSVQKLTLDNAKLSSDLTVANASVQKLTADNAELNNRHQAAVRQVSETTSNLNAVNTQISRMCLEVGCLELADESGKAIKADADEASKVAAADKISVGDKLKAFKGAVNSAMAKTGVNISQLPTPPAAGGTEKAKGPELTGVERAMAAHQAKLEAGKK